MKKIFIILSAIVLLTGGCKKEYQNPNAPTQDEVFSSADGMTRLIVGLKQRFAVNTLAVSSVYGAISASALTTREVAVLNAGNADLAQLEIGGSNVAPNNGLISGLWTTTNIINSEAQKLIDNASKIGDVNYRNAVIIYAHLYKAMALGTLSTFWERVPINAGANAQFSTRNEALQAAVKLLDDASTLLQNNPVPAAFTSAVGGEIDLRNTLLALSARYNMMLLNNDQAISKASAVNLASRSVFFYNNLNPNPVFRSSLINNNTYGIRTNPSFGLTGDLAPNPNDKRIAFHLTKNPANDPIGPNGSGFFKSDATAIPIYLPGEMLLIQAEAYARKGDLVNAVLFLNRVLTKKPTEDAFGIGADLPPYAGPITQAAILQEIYKNRVIELYMLGLKLEDSRRFGRPGPGTPNAERSRNFYPYPQQERDGNTNTPGDPTI
ncbi:MAG TPA: RagB/SusD family nutrient uptake outer membrane protein [Flavisolibacter sp.]|nr:RagB/SusD family nutrient uptake outer membrane protein [Flavisolibacter sp.]